MTPANLARCLVGERPDPGTIDPAVEFFVARPKDSIRTIDQQLDRCMNLLLTPGVYRVAGTIGIQRSDTVVLAMGMATLAAVDGAVVMEVTNAEGVDLAGITIDVGTKNSSPSPTRPTTVSPSGAGPTLYT